ncbi:MAG TPA: FkbM family methyltransferase, partial [Candidatus Methylacidiphilales bacterium]
VGEHFRTGWLRQQLRTLYHGVLMAQTGGRGLDCRMPGGEDVRLLPGLHFANWNRAEYNAFRHAMREGTVVFDVGANVGAYSILFARWAGPQGKIFAFEPAPESFLGLTRHIRLNGFEGLVFPQQKAISDSPGTLEFLADRFYGTNRVLDKHEARPQGAVIQVEALTIDEFCSQNNLHPDFIKIDIEGYELAALRGARNTLRECRGKLALFIEMHPDVWPKVGITRADIEAELQSQGWTVETLTDQEIPWKTNGVCLRVVPQPDR